MKSFIIFLILTFSLSSYAFKLNGVRCKDLPRKSCEKKKCKCLRGIHRKKKGKSIKHKVTKKGKPTPQGFCYDHAEDGEAAWKAFLETRPKLESKCR
jgi:hypothetical protein